MKLKMFENLYWDISIILIVKNVNYSFFMYITQSFEL